MPAAANQSALYAQATEAYGASLERLARAYELNAEARRDLLQEIHLQLWRSLDRFDQRCSLRTWVYRVAHNVATDHVLRQRRLRDRLETLESLESVPRMPAPGGEDGLEGAAGRSEALDRLAKMIRRLKPLDRQVIVSYLEGLDAASSAEITGLSPANVAMKIHRIKNLLKRWFDEGAPHAG